MTNAIATEGAAALTPGKKAKITWSLFWRTMFIMFCTSYTKQQGTTFAFMMIPYLEDIYGKETDEFYEAIQRHQNFFNTTPQYASFIFALVISMEYDRKAALSRGEEFDDASIEAIKVALMGPLAGIGDAITLSCLRIIAIGVSVGFAQQGSWLGPILFALVYNVPDLIIHYLCGSLGMRLGTGFITEALASGKMQALTKGFTVLGMIMTGAMVAQFVSVKTTLVVDMGGGAVFNLQNMLNSILPGLFPLLLTLGSFMYLRRSRSKNSAMILLLIMIVIAIVLTLLGVTG
ncbi:PTS system mannose/fructose/sorbose family IID component [Coriobacterium glomerans PW2]|uniref:PTS system mannose/fructose/sorbose family IID component n=1 Tax=Coriobacterium glomerans (strain ATCC 49209 / DSM 20642 / JCM 10262 / PW2) TaxID=700015 RepID=F2NB25_CORGP|nr:PTS system mannose/fructose/sorbose family transporter subunit IID [Coriobacterium glomerans]AEB07776.1 PTS system mannose/fructose/sorbose family IID component [Coriobacterium glomerans PW2]